MSQQNLRIISQYKNDLIRYFDNIKSQIDVTCQSILLKVKNESVRKYLLDENQNMIQVIDEMLNSNLKKINTHEFNNDVVIANEQDFKEALKKKLIENYCYYVQRERLNNLIQCNDVSPLGFMLITDWYLDKNQLNFLKFMIEEKDVDDFCNATLYYDSNILRLHQALFNFDYRIEFCKGSILKLEKSVIQEKLSHKEKLCLNFDDWMDSFESYDRIEFQKNSFDQMKNLNSLTLIHSNLNKSIKINARTFTGLPKLSLLLLPNKDNIFIDSNAFCSIIKLDTLLLAANNLKPGTLNGLENCLNSLGIIINERTLKNVDFTLLKCLNKLKCLEILSFDVKEIDNNSFIGVEQVEILRIICDNLETIEDDAFKSLTNLKELHVYSYKLKKFKRPIIPKN